jgi:hypothetical protein
VAKVDPTSLVLNRLLAGLEQPITDAENAALRSAVTALPKNALVTTIAIDAFALRPALESALIFRLFAKAHPEQVNAHLYASSNLAAVMRSIFAAEPTLVKDFLARMEIDPEKDLTGVRFDAPIQSLEVKKVDGEKAQLELAITLRGDADPRALTIDRTADRAWTFAFGGEKQRPLAELDLAALADLKKHLEARAEGGARDPLLNLLRSNVAERSGGLLKEAVQEIDRLHREKRNARLEHLRQIDEALRMLLGSSSVGETDKSAIDEMAAGLYPREKD